MESKINLIDHGIRSGRKENRSLTINSPAYLFSSHTFLTLGKFLDLNFIMCKMMGLELNFLGPFSINKPSLTTRSYDWCLDLKSPSSPDLNFFDKLLNLPVNQLPQGPNTDNSIILSF